MDSDYMACLAWQPLLALLPSWCNTGGLPSLLRAASSRAQQIPREQTTWYSAGLMAHQTPLPLCSAGPLAQSLPEHRHSPTQSFTERPLDWGQGMLSHWSLTPSKTVDQIFPPWWDGEGLRLSCHIIPRLCELNLLCRTCGAEFQWVGEERRSDCMKRCGISFLCHFTSGL